MEQEALLTVQEAATWIGLPEAAIRTAALGGRLPFVRKDRRSWIEPAQLKAYWERLDSSVKNIQGVLPEAKQQTD